MYFQVEKKREHTTNFTKRAAFKFQSINIYVERLLFDGFKFFN